ncbi:MAG: CoA-binding protein [Verrucomicrobiae bacterium]|nr:CoA-binding protein [Verrucomicrobiae bacterium]
MNVAVLGASSRPDRYSYKAVQLLRQNGHVVYPVNPALTEIDGLRVWPSLRAIPATLDVVTVYLSQKNQEQIAEELLACNAPRVIFNPGTENPDLAKRLREHGKEVLQACTLVLLKTGQFTSRLGSGSLT